MKISDLKTILLDQHQIELEPNLIVREQFSALSDWQKDSNIIIISGLRRCGKSTLQHQQKEILVRYNISNDSWFQV